MGQQDETRFTFLFLFIFSFAFCFNLVLLTSCNIMVLFFGKLAVMCSKPKHLKHFMLEVLVGDLGVKVEGLFLETFW